MRCHFLGGLTVAIMLVSGAAQASSLVYRPVNPNFGGDAFNGAYLLNTAQANNHYEKPAKKTNPLDNFERTITSSLLNRVSQQIADRIFSGTGQDTGTFQLGNTSLTYQRNGDVVDITIFDGVTGTSTTISVPAPQL
jgi:curli production assembly/transport component CsgF